MDWRPINEAPIEKPVLIYDPNHTVTTRLGSRRMQPVAVAWYVLRYWYAYWDNHYPPNIFNPTHWMPIPEPPTGE